jgi:hypothetical protein
MGMWESLRQHTAIRETARCLAGAAAGFVLAGAGVGGSVLPLAAAFLASEKTIVRSAAALLGAAAGAVVFWSALQALELAAVCLLAFAARCILEGIVSAGRIMPAVTTAAAAAVGFVFLIDSGFTLLMVSRYAGKITLTALAAVGFRHRAAEQEDWAMLLTAACFVAGLGGIGTPVGASPAIVMAAFFAAAADWSVRGIAAAAAFGVAAELQLPGSGAAASLAAASMLCTLLHGLSRPLRRLVFAVLAAMGMVVSSGSGMLAASAAVGALLAMPLQQTLFLPATPPKRNEKLDEAALSMEQLHRMLEPQGSRTARQPETAVVFDKAAAQVCRCCVRYQLCWEQSAADTYRDLCQAARPMLERGMIEREDFPAGFAGRCRHLEGFLKAVNQELDSMAYRRQFHARVQETRTIAADQYRYLAQMLEEAARPASPVPTLRFDWEVAVRGRGRSGNTISGDLGACFRGPEDKLYVLLCDGMGTGAQAAGESRTAVSVLTGLLRAGASADCAMQLLNGAYTLRADGAFATVDLVQVSLTTGECILYKWGAAVSFLRQGNRVKKIGTATVPPGFGVGGDHAAGQTRLSLRGEEMLILLSDGAQSEETEQRIASWQGGSPEALAERIVYQRAPEDDVTAVVLRLRSVL